MSKVVGLDEFKKRFLLAKHKNIKIDFGSYSGMKHRISAICEIHNFQWQPFAYEIAPPIESKRKPKGCRKCAGHDLTWEEVKTLFQNKYDNYYTYFSKTYVNMTTKMDMKCPNPEHPKFSQTPSAHISKKGGCVSCGHETAGYKRRLRNREKLKKKCVEVHGDKFNYAETDFTKGVGSGSIKKSYTTFICKLHPDEDIRICIGDHLRYKYGGCNKCYSEDMSERQRMALDHYIQKAHKIHDFKYDYSLVEQFTNQHQIISIICPIHGIFKKEAANHINVRLEQGCPACALDQTRKKLQLNLSDFLESARVMHGDKYDYSEIKNLPSGSQTEITIICPVKGHGEDGKGRFKQIAKNHLSGHGCSECGKIKSADANRITISHFVKKSKKIHKDKFDYSKTIWNGSDNPVEIFCREGNHYFEIIPHNHTSLERGCTICGQKMRINQNKWLDHMGLPDDREHREVRIKYANKFYIADGYDPKTKTVYEFNGDFWHGNPKKYKKNDINPISGISYGELYSRTLKKEHALKKAGYQVLSIWESDWNNT